MLVEDVRSIVYFLHFFKAWRELAQTSIDYYWLFFFLVKMQILLSRLWCWNETGCVLACRHKGFLLNLVRDVRSIGVVFRLSKQTNSRILLILLVSFQGFRGFQNHKRMVLLLLFDCLLVKSSPRNSFWWLNSDFCKNTA